MTDDNENFQRLVSGGYGQAEMQLGSEAYQSQVEYNKALVRLNDSQVALNQMQLHAQRETLGHLLATNVEQIEVEKQRAAYWRNLSVLLYAVTLVVLLASIPTIVLLWRSAV